MTNQDIAQRLYELCKAGDYATCYEELYSPDIVSIEADGSQVQGFDAIAAKGKEWNANIEEFKEANLGEPVVSGNYFSIPMNMTLKYKGAPDFVKFEEICVYQIKDGKIVKEQFFYDQAG